MIKSEIRRKRWDLCISLIGLFTIGLLSNVIKKDGIADFSFTYELFAVISSLFLCWLPEYLFRMIRSRMTKEQFKNAGKVWKAMFVYAAVIGVLGSLFFYILSKIMENHRGFLGEYTYLAMRSFAIVFLLSSFVQVFYGYFQGMGTGMPKLLSGVLLQILGIPFILLFARKEYTYGEKVGKLLQNDSLAGNYGSMGAVRGYLLMYGLMLLFLVLLYLLFLKRNKRSKEGLRLSEDGRDILVNAVKIEWTGALTRMLLSGFVFTGLLLFYRVSRSIPAVSAAESSAYTEFSDFGIYYGNFLVLMGMETLILLMLTVPARLEWVQAYRKEEKRNMQQLGSVSVLTLFLYGFFFTAYNAVIPGCLAETFFGKGEHTLLVLMLRAGCLLPLFLASGIFFLYILRDTGRQKMALLCTLGAFAGFVLTVSVCLKSMNGNVMALVVGTLVFSVVLALSTALLVHRYMVIRIEWVRMVLMPLISAGLTAGALFALTKAMTSLSVGFLALLISLIVGFLLYVFLLLFLRCIRKKDLVCFPLGKIIGKVANRTNLLS